MFMPGLCRDPQLGIFLAMGMSAALGELAYVDFPRLQFQEPNRILRNALKITLSMCGPCPCPSSL